MRLQEPRAESRQECSYICSASLYPLVWGEFAWKPLFVGQIDQVCSEQMLAFTTLINTDSWRNWEMGKGFEKDFCQRKTRSLALSLKAVKL